jgi:hypothetical protein
MSGQEASKQPAPGAEPLPVVIPQQVPDPDSREAWEELLKAMNMRRPATYYANSINSAPGLTDANAAILGDAYQKGRVQACCNAVGRLVHDPAKPHVGVGWLTNGTLNAYEKHVGMLVLAFFSPRVHILSDSQCIKKGKYPGRIVIAARESIIALVDAIGKDHLKENRQSIHDFDYDLDKETDVSNVIYTCTTGDQARVLFEVNGKPISHAIMMMGYIPDSNSSFDQMAVCLLAEPVKDVTPLLVHAAPLYYSLLDGTAHNVLLASYPLDNPSPEKMQLFKTRFQYEPKNGQQKYVSIGQVQSHDQRKNRLHHNAVILGRCPGVPLFDVGLDQVVGVQIEGDSGCSYSAMDGAASLGRAKDHLFSSMKKILGEKDENGDASDDDIEDA